MSHRKSLLVVAFAFTSFCIVSRSAAGQYTGSVVIQGDPTETVPYCTGHTCQDEPVRGYVGVTINGTVYQQEYDQTSDLNVVSTHLCNLLSSSGTISCTGVSGTTNNWTLSLSAGSNVNISPYGRVVSPSAQSQGVVYSTVPASDTILPAYYIMTVLPVAPGNTSSNGFTNSTSYGTTTSISNSFASGTSLSFSVTGGFLATTTYGVSFGTTNSSTDASSFQLTYQSGNGSTLRSVSNVPDHNQDQIFLLLNPQIGITQTGTNQGVYTMATQNGQPADIVNVNVGDLKNPPAIPLGILLPQTVGGQTLPGLKKICANPLPDNACTQNNACGCVASDFAAIIQADPLANANSSTPPPAVDSTRYSQTAIQSTTLQGPPCQGCAPISNTFTASDSSSQSQTFSQQNSYSVAFTRGAGFGLPLGFHLNYSSTNSLTFTNSASQGSQNGVAHQASITLGTNSVGCYEGVDIYEDLIYHTFAAYVPSVASNCQ